MGEVQDTMNKFLDKCREENLPVTEQSGTLWEEAGDGHAPISNMEVAVAVVDGITILMENPDGRNLCFFIFGSGPKAEKLQEIWDLD